MINFNDKNPVRFHITITLLLITILAACQKLPVKKLEKLGHNQAEIEATAKLNGKNGVNGYYLLARIRVDTPFMGAWSKNLAYELYSPRGKTTKLTKFNNNIVTLIHFDILKNHVVLVERSPFHKVTVSKFNLMGNLERQIVASIACRYNNNCSWIHEKTKKLALYDIKKNEDGVYLSRNAGYVFEYNWKTDETRIISEGIPMHTDARTGQNFALKDVTFNEKTYHFEYLQEIENK